MEKESPKNNEPEKPKKPTVGELIKEKGVDGLTDFELDACIYHLCQPSYGYPGTDNHRVTTGFCLSMERQRRLMNELEKRNSKTQFWFMVLAVGSILLGGASLLWQIGTDTHLISLPEHKEHSTQTSDSAQGIQDTQVLPPISQPAKETNP